MKAEGLISEECLTTDENSCKGKQIVSQRQGVWELGAMGRVVRGVVQFQGTDGFQEGHSRGRLEQESLLCSRFQHFLFFFPSSLIELL